METTILEVVYKSQISGMKSEASLKQRPAQADGHAGVQAL